MRTRWLVAAGLATLGMLPWRLSAHEIASDVSVRMLVQAEANQARVWLRLPLRAMRDIPFPETNTGYLEMERGHALLPDASNLWIGSFLDLRQNGVRILRPRLESARIALPSETAFTTIEGARRAMQSAPLPTGVNLPLAQAMLEVAYLFPLQPGEGKLQIQPVLSHLGARVSTSLLYRSQEGKERAYAFHESPGLIELDPSWWQAATGFVRLGFGHILEGLDHLLFLACLVIPIRRIRPLVGIVTAFTLAHSITLLASAYGWAPQQAWFPPLVETLIAASIVFMALENIIWDHTAPEVGPSPTAALPRPKRWVMALGFGLIHGFGFSFALRESLQMAGDHLLLSLLAFNVGVELGQLLVLLALVPLLELVFTKLVPERMGTVVGSAFLAHTGWHWLLERGEQLAQFPLAEWLSGEGVVWLGRAGLLVLLAISLWQLRKLWPRRSAP